MPKPIIHSRDHEHGGADPVRILWESDDGGGTGGGGAVTVEQWTGNTVTISPNTSGTITWDTPVAGSSALVDYSAPAAPTVLLDGVYVFSAEVWPTGGLTNVGDEYFMTLHVNSSTVGQVYGAGAAWQVGTASGVTSDFAAAAPAVTSVPHQMTAGDGFTAVVSFGRIMGGTGTSVSFYLSRGTVAKLG
jgi:hypothetical protein